MSFRLINKSLSLIMYTYVKLYSNISINFASDYKLLRANMREYVVYIISVIITFGITIYIHYDKLDNPNIEKLLEDFEWRKVIEYQLTLLFAKLKLWSVER